jgi:lipase ATG15
MLLFLSLFSLTYSFTFTKSDVINFAKMSHNTYLDIDSVDWLNLDDEWNNFYTHIGNDDGIRGYIFHDKTDSRIIIALKGTNPTFYGIGGGKTSESDKFNDNLMFSCCCAHESICKCNINSKICNFSCLNNYMIDSYYYKALNYVKNILEEYSDKKIFLTGHSLGASLASLIGNEMNIPAITFEAPGGKLFMTKFGLQINNFKNIYQFGLDDDPIFMGTCNGFMSVCKIAGYIMDSKCHIGNVCIFKDSRLKNKNILHHRMAYIINYLESLLELPSCNLQINCKECKDWSWGRIEELK